MRHLKKGTYNTILTIFDILCSLSSAHQSSQVANSAVDRIANETSEERYLL